MEERQIYIYIYIYIYIQTDRQSKRVGVYRRQYGVDDSWLNLSTNLSTVPTQKPVKIEILSQQLRIAYEIMWNMQSLILSVPFPSIFNKHCIALSSLIALSSFNRLADLWT